MTAKASVEAFVAALIAMLLAPRILLEIKEVVVIIQEKSVEHYNSSLTDFSRVMLFTQ